jgi:hypothetical protein
MNLYTYHIKEQNEEIINSHSDFDNKSFQVNMNKKIFQVDFKNSFTPVKKLKNSNFSHNKKSVSNNVSFNSGYNKNMNSNLTTINTNDNSAQKIKITNKLSPLTKFKLKDLSSKTSLRSISTQLTNSTNNKAALSQRSLTNNINISLIKEKSLAQNKLKNISKEYIKDNEHLNYESHIDQVLANHKSLVERIHKEREEAIKLKIEKLASLQKKKDLENENFKVNQHEKSKILKIKRKIQSIVNNEAKDLCNNFQFQENYSNGKVINYMKSDKYKNNLKKYHKIFRFDKNEPTSDMLNPSRHAFDFDKIRQNKDLEKNDLFKNRFSAEELEMIRLDPEYYIGNKSFFKEVAVLKQTNLLQKLEKEDIDFKQKQENKKKRLKRLKSISMGVEILETEQLKHELNKNPSTNNLFQNYQKNKNISKSNNVSLIFDSSSTDIKTFKSNNDNLIMPKIKVNQNNKPNHNITLSLDSLIQSYQISTKKYLNESIVQTNIQEYIQNRNRKKELNDILTQKILKEEFWKSKVQSDIVCSNFVFNSSVNLEKSKYMKSINLN